MIRIKKEFLEDYKSRGYIENNDGYKLKSKKNCGVFIKEFGYIILNGEWEEIK